MIRFSLRSIFRGVLAATLSIPSPGAEASRVAPRHTFCSLFASNALSATFLSDCSPLTAVRQKARVARQRFAWGNPLAPALAGAAMGPGTALPNHVIASYDINRVSGEKGWEHRMFDDLAQLRDHLAKGEIGAAWQKLGVLRAEMHFAAWARYQHTYESVLASMTEYEAILTALRRHWQPVLDDLRGATLLPALFGPRIVRAWEQLPPESLVAARLSFDKAWDDRLASYGSNREAAASAKRNAYPVFYSAAVRLRQVGDPFAQRLEFLMAQIEKDLVHARPPLPSREGMALNELSMAAHHQYLSEAIAVLKAYGDNSDFLDRFSTGGAHKSVELLQLLLKAFAQSGGSEEAVLGTVRESPTLQRWLRVARDHRFLDATLDRAAADLLLLIEVGDSARNLASRLQEGYEKADRAFREGDFESALLIIDRLAVIRTWAHKDGTDPIGTHWSDEVLYELDVLMAELVLKGASMFPQAIATKPVDPFAAADSFVSTLTEESADMSERLKQSRLARARRRLEEFVKNPGSWDRESVQKFIELCAAAAPVLASTDESPVLGMGARIEEAAAIETLLRQALDRHDGLLAWRLLGHRSLDFKTLRRLRMDSMAYVVLLDSYGTRWKDFMTGVLRDQTDGWPLLFLDDVEQAAEATGRSDLASLAASFAADSGQEALLGTVPSRDHVADLAPLSAISIQTNGPIALGFGSRRLHLRMFDGEWLWRDASSPLSNYQSAHGLFELAPEWPVSVIPEDDGRLTIENMDSEQPVSLFVPESFWEKEVRLDAANHIVRQFRSAKAVTRFKQVLASRHAGWVWLSLHRDGRLGSVLPPECNQEKLAASQVGDRFVRLRLTPENLFEIQGPPYWVVFNEEQKYVLQPLPGHAIPATLRAAFDQLRKPSPSLADLDEDNSATTSLNGVGLLWRYARKTPGTAFASMAIALFMALAEFSVTDAIMMASVTLLPWHVILRRTPSLVDRLRRAA